MKNFNLVKSLRNVVSNRKGLLILCVSLVTFGVESVWGTYYGKFSVSVSTNSTGKGTVYAADKNNATSEASSVSISTGTKSGSVSAYAFATPNAGYHLQGWSKTNGNSDLGTNNPYTMSGSASSKSDGTNDNGTWYATFAANTDTKYIVKHYQQNVAGTGYDLAETDNLTGTTDAKVTPARKSYTGFTTPAGQEVTIKGDGTASVSYNYTRNSYTLTWNLAGGSVTTAGTAAGQVKYGATLTSPEVSKQGALFNGWSPEVPATMPAENVTYTAQWVSKYNIEVTGSNQNMKVGNTQDNAFTFVHAENPVPHISVVSLDPINNGDGQVIEYDAANNKIIAHNAGTATIYFTQAGTEVMYESTSASFTYTVTKNDNTLYINGTPNTLSHTLYVDQNWNVSLTATNTDYSNSPITATPNNDVTTINTAKTQVSSNYKLGDATWTLSQPENYKYNAANASFTIHVVKQAEATDCYVLNDANERSWSTISTSGSYGPFDAAGTTLQFDAKRTAILGVTNTTKFYAQYSTDGSNWTNCLTIDLGDKDKWYPLSCSIPETAKYVRFETQTGATGNKQIRNVRVTRKTYLNATDFTINTQENNATLVYPGTTGTGSFRVDYSLANGGDLKIVCDNPKFTIDKTTQTNVDCQTGSFDVNMTYISQTAGTDYAHVVVYNNVYRKEITVTGITQKHRQELKWKANFDQMSLGQEVNDAASSTHGAVTYVSENPEIIRVDNGTTLVAVAKGETKITATAAGDEEYEEKSIEKTIAVTENHVQYIVWTQSLMGLKLGGDDKTLNAYATSEEEEGVASERAITYTSDNTGVVTVDGNQLTIVGVGTANITAKQAGGNYDGIIYEAVEKVNKVVVKDPSAKCEAFVYEQNGDVEEFFAMNTNEIIGTEHPLTGEPAKLTFNAKREYWKLVINYSKGNIVVDAYSASKGWQQVLDCGEPPIGSYTGYSVNLNRDVTKIRFRRPSGAQGYHYIADAKVEQVRYIETSTPSTTFQANVGEMQQQTILLNYSNLTGDIQLAMAGGENSHFSIDKTEIAGDCGDAKKNVALTITYTPTLSTEDMTDGKESETLVITDGTTRCEVKLYGKATKIDRDIVWNINDENNVYTVEQIALTATAETKLHQPAGEVVYNIVGESTAGCGKIQNNVLSFAKNGTVYVEASTVESDQYNPAVALTKTWVVAKTPTEVTSTPEINGDIVCGNQLSDLTLKAATGAARNTVNQQPVKGTFAITAGDISTAGQHSITLTFTPENTDMYLPCTTDMTVTVQENMFTNASGDKQWNNPANWVSGSVPTASETMKVIVSDTLEICSDVQISSLTMEQDATVVIANGGNLHVLGEPSSTDHKGSLSIKNGGQLHMKDDASLYVNDFGMETSIGSAGSDMSAQVFNVSRIHAEHAYLDIHLDPSGQVHDDTQWYGIAVPFSVKLTGIARKDASQFTPVKDGRDFMVYQYDMNKRLNTGKGWVRTTTDLQPGVFYYFTVNGANNTYRFYASSSEFTEQTSAPLLVNGTGADANWNGMSNSLFHYASVDFENQDGADAYVQVYLNGKSAYQVVKADEASFVVGCPFFVQASQNSTLELSNAESEQAFYAPQRTATQSTTVKVQLRNAANDQDQLYLTASETASTTYTLGHDLAKAGVATSIPQVWVAEYAKQLCVHEALLHNDEAFCSLGIYAPKTGTYTLLANEIDDNTTLFVTINGQAVWNLAWSPYELNLTRGTNTEYGLLLQHRKSVATAAEETTDTENRAVEKVLHNGQLFILTPECVINAQGQKIK